MFRLKNKNHSKREELYFPGFAYPANQLSSFLYVIDVFIIALKDGQIIRHEADSSQEFLNWLLKHQIRNVTKLVKKECME